MQAVADDRAEVADAGSGRHVVVLHRSLEVAEQLRLVGGQVELRGHGAAGLEGLGDGVVRTVGRRGRHQVVQLRRRRRYGLGARRGAPELLVGQGGAHHAR